MGLTAAKVTSVIEWMLDGFSGKSQLPSKVNGRRIFISKAVVLVILSY
jgi:hypothetical protein